MKRSRRLLLSTAVAAIVLMGGAIAARQVPQQARQRPDPPCVPP